MKRKLIVYTLLVSFELLLLAIIVILGTKIFHLSKDKVKGIQYVTAIKKEDLTFPNENKPLKYFYEPKPSHISISAADWLGYEVKNKINSDSLNERYEYSIAKPKNT